MSDSVFGIFFRLIFRNITLLRNCLSYNLIFYPQRRHAKIFGWAKSLAHDRRSTSVYGL